MILSSSDIFQQNSVLKCVFYCSTVMQNFVRKSAPVVEI